MRLSGRLCHSIYEAVSMPARQRRSADNKLARWRSTKAAHEENPSNKSFKTSETGGRVFQSVKRQREYPGYRPRTPEPESSGTSMPILIGAGMIAAAILLSTLGNAHGSRYVGVETPTEENAWVG